MNGVDRSRAWKNLKQRVGLKGVGCCGANWIFRTQRNRITISAVEEEEAPAPAVEEEEEEEEETHRHQNNPQECGMNLAAALAAERNLRTDGNDVGPGQDSAGNVVKSLMTLIEETDGVDWKKKKNGGDDDVGAGEGSDWMCCVCMERSKGAAFIPCGHAFCRVCSRELWVNRGCCAVCNRSIVEILDIF